MPVITLNNVVFPAPFGPMIALRSPRMMRKLTSRTACRPPKLLHSDLSSSTGSPLSAVTRQAFVVQGKTLGIVLQSPASSGRLLAVLAGREVAAIDRLLQ